MCPLPPHFKYLSVTRHVRKDLQCLKYLEMKIAHGGTMLGVQLFSHFSCSSSWLILCEERVNWHLKYKVFTGTKQHIIKTLQRQSCTGSDWQGNKEGEFINSDKAGGVDLVLCLAGSPAVSFTVSQTPHTNTNSWSKCDLSYPKRENLTKFPMVSLFSFSKGKWLLLCHYSSAASFGSRI